MPAPPRSDRRSVVQVSDVHVVADGRLYGAVDPLANLVAVLESVDASGAPPDAVIFSGDLADRGEPEAYRRFRAAAAPFLARWDVPVVYLPGNHDVRAPFREHLLGLEPSGDAIDGVTWVDGLRIVALDSTVPGASYGDLRSEQLVWLADVLAAPAPLGTLLVLHHPPVPGPIEVMNEISLRVPEWLARVVAGTDVAMILAGHAHHTSGGALAGIPVWVGTATAYQMDVPTGVTGIVCGRSGSAYSRIDVVDGAAVATNVALPASGARLYEVSADELRKAFASEVH
jgi:3',5'-cyclic-AMP phosphodiesterase